MTSILGSAGLALLAASSADPAAPENGSRPWVFAAEDTLELPALFEMSEVEIRATRLQIGDIVSRCIESEEKLQESISSLVVTQSVRTVLHVGGYGAGARKQLVIEQVDRLFFRKPDERRTVRLSVERYVLEDGERRPWKEADEETVEIRWEDFSSLPFYLADRDQYDFRIASREIVGDRVIYEVQLSPRSDFEIAPSGTIWVDTSTFRILREEFDFGDRVPMPMFVKSVGPFIRERERIGDTWVWKRFLVRATFRMGWLRFLEKDIPDVIELMVSFRDHRLNEGWGAMGETEPAVADR